MEEVIVTPTQTSSDIPGGAAWCAAEACKRARQSSTDPKGIRYEYSEAAESTPGEHLQLLASRIACTSATHHKCTVAAIVTRKSRKRESDGSTKDGLTGWAVCGA